MRSVLSLLTVAVLTSVVATQSADAGLFGHFKRSSCDSCAPEPSCAAPAEPSCCAPVAPTCCAPVAPTCCAPAPACCEADPCCDPCGKRRCRLFSGRLLRKLKRKNACCPDACCEPEPVTCCAPAAVTCCAPAEVSCCAPAAVTCAAPPAAE